MGAETADVESQLSDQYNYDQSTPQIPHSEQHTAATSSTANGNVGTAASKAESAEDRASVPTFQFVSFVLEPSKKTNMSMKKRDKTKPLIDSTIIEKQINFQNRLLHYQQQANNAHGSLQNLAAKRLDDRRSKKVDKNGGASRADKNADVPPGPIQRGNMGFCPLDMSLVNLCGVPSLWMGSKDFVNGCTTIPQSDDSSQVMPYIKPYQKKLMKKQAKMLSLLKFHKVFENEKYFGRSMNAMHSQVNQIIFQDFYFFTTDFLKDNNRYKSNLNEFKQVDSQTSEAAGSLQSHQSVNNYLSNLRSQESVLQVVCGSHDIFEPELPIIQDPDPAFFKLINSESKILKHILTSHGIQQTDQNEWNLLWTCVSLQNKVQIYETMNENQKINHFLNSVELTRKDKFAENIARMKNKFGFYEFDFMPETFQLPEDYQNFQQRFNQIKGQIKEKKKQAAADGAHQGDELDNQWIVKPSQSSQGKGIYIIDNLNEINQFCQPPIGMTSQQEKTVVSKYLSNPLLINKHKFDLRIYVLLTSIDPLRIYVYNEGLVRFASEPYDRQKGQLKNLYAHLTNYSINKKSASFQQNKSVLERDHGNKWSLSALQAHLENLGINMQPIWERIYDSIIKSIISIEGHLQAGVKKTSVHRQNCFELFGFDILLDSNFKPHILEVNFSPSLSADSPLDYHIKSNLLVDTLNIVGLKRNLKKRGGSNYNSIVAAQRFRSGVTLNFNLNNANHSLGFIQVNQATSKTTKDQKAKENWHQSKDKNDLKNFTRFLSSGNVDHYFFDRLSKISAKHRELIFETLEEFHRNKNMNFTCIYPSPGSSSYDKYFSSGPRQSNQLIYRYLFTKNEVYSLIKQISEYLKQTQLAHSSLQIPEMSMQNEEDNDIREGEDIASDLDSQNSSGKTPTQPVTKEPQGPSPAQSNKNQAPDSSTAEKRQEPASKEPEEGKQLINIVEDGDDKSSPSNVPSATIPQTQTTLSINLESSILGKDEEAKKQEDPSPLLLKTTVGGEAEIDVGIVSPMSPDPVKDLNPLMKSPRSPNPPDPIQSKSPLILTETNQESATAEKKEEKASPRYEKRPRSKPATSSSKRVTSESRKTEATKSQKGEKQSERGQQGEKKKEKQKMIITGDDILIEYVSRLVVLLNSILTLYQSKFKEDQGSSIDVIIPSSIRQTLDQFTRHKIWSNKFGERHDAQGIVAKIKMRHTEMVDRRQRILKSQLKKQNPSMSSEDILGQLEQQDKTREKIVSRISSQKIEKMVKQSNLENQIDIVSILVEGCFVLPSQMQTSSGKQVIKGTLQSLKLFEKILKQTSVEQLKSCNLFTHTTTSKPATISTQKPAAQGNILSEKDFRSENKRSEILASKGRYIIPEDKKTYMFNSEQKPTEQVKKFLKESESGATLLQHRDFELQSNSKNDNIMRILNQNASKHPIYQTNKDQTQSPHEFINEIGNLSSSFANQNLVDDRPQQQQQHLHQRNSCSLIDCNGGSNNNVTDRMQVMKGKAGNRLFSQVGDEKLTQFRMDNRLHLNQVANQSQISLPGQLPGASLPQTSLPSSYPQNIKQQMKQEFEDQKLFLAQNNQAKTNILAQQAKTLNFERYQTVANSLSNDNRIHLQKMYVNDDTGASKTHGGVRSTGDPANGNQLQNEMLKQINNNRLINRNSSSGVPPPDQAILFQNGHKQGTPGMKISDGILKYPTVNEAAGTTSGSGIAGGSKATSMYSQAQGLIGSTTMIQPNLMSPQIQKTNASIERIKQGIVINSQTVCKRNQNVLAGTGSQNQNFIENMQGSTISDQAASKLRKQMTYQQSKTDKPRLFSQTGATSKSNFGDQSVPGVSQKHKNLRPNFQVTLTQNNAYSLKEDPQFKKRGDSQSQPCCQSSLHMQHKNRILSLDSSKKSQQVYESNQMGSGFAGLSLQEKNETPYYKLNDPGSAHKSRQQSKGISLPLINLTQDKKSLAGVPVTSSVPQNSEKMKLVQLQQLNQSNQQFQLQQIRHKTNFDQYSNQQSALPTGNSATTCKQRPSAPIGNGMGLYTSEEKNESNFSHYQNSLIENSHLLQQQSPRSTKNQAEGAFGQGIINQN